MGGPLEIRLVGEIAVRPGGVAGARRSARGARAARLLPVGRVVPGRTRGGTPARDRDLDGAGRAAARDGAGGGARARAGVGRAGSAGGTGARRGDRATG